MTDIQAYKESSLNKSIFRGWLSAFILVFIYSANIYVRLTDPPTNAISWDVLGYYLYLPFTFIYHDLGLQHKEILDGLIETYKSTSPFYQATMASSGNWIMKYSSGMAILYSPGFFVGHIWALLTDFPADGFSLPYQISLIANGTLFFFIGQYFFRKVLLNLFNDKITALVMLMFYFGTNLYSYTAWSAEMPHSYIFTLYTLIIWFTIKWHKSYKFKNIIGLAVTIGIATLARPTEIISIFIPLLWNVTNKQSLKNKYKLLYSNWKQLLIFTIILLLIGAIQIVYWKIYSGKLIYYSYVNPGEGFEFLWPYTLKVLFSFRKGWFIYTPLMIFAVIGFIPLYKKNRGLFTPLIIFLFINLWIVSSWSCWWYAQSLGQRALVQSYAIMAIPFGFFVSSLKSKSVWIKFVFGLLGLFFIALNLFQGWQLRNGVISGDRMTFEYYVRTFGKTTASPEDKKLLLINRFFGGVKETIKDESKFSKKNVYSNSFEGISKAHRCDSLSHKGGYSIRMDSSISFSPSFKAKYKDITNKYYAWVRASVWVYPIYEIKETPTLLVVTFLHKGKAYKYRTIDLRNEKLKLHQWNKISLDYLTPEVRSSNDELSVYIWNRGKKEIYFDDLEVVVFD